MIVAVRGLFLDAFLGEAPSTVMHQRAPIGFRRGVPQAIEVLCFQIHNRFKKFLRNS
jgi:hypothetical protein